MTMGAPTLFNLAALSPAGLMLITLNQGNHRTPLRAPQPRRKRSVPLCLPVLSISKEFQTQALADRSQFFWAREILHQNPRR
jgi:hypothetical protein